MFDRRFVFAIPLLAMLGGCATAPAPVSVADTIAREPQLSTLNGLVQQAGLTETLQATGPFTVFAPTNDAFKAMPAKAMADLGHDPAALKNVLAFHVVPGRMMASDVRNGSVKTSQGASVELSKAGEFVTVEDAVVQTADISANNGVVHTIDRVLTPPVRR